MTTLYEYRYNAQFEKSIGQFMRVFTGFQVRDEVDRGSGFVTRRVPVKYSTIDRVVADLQSKRDSFSATTLPLMVVNMDSFVMDVEEFGPKYHKDQFGTEETPTESITRLIGPSVVMNMSLSIIASSRNELLQLVEQILLIFNPKITINIDDSLTNADYITEISLSDISEETIMPVGTGNSSPMMTMNFKVPFRLKYPHKIDDNIITQIIMNIKDFDSGETIIEDIIV